MFAFFLEEAGKKELCFTVPAQKFHNLNQDGDMQRVETKGYILHL